MSRLFFTGILLFSLTSVMAQNRAGNAGDASRWQHIEKLIEDGLPQSALTKIDEAYQEALKNREYGQLLKAVTFRINCLRMSEDNPDIAIIRSLFKDAEVTPRPMKSVIWSLTGEAFKNYYVRNRWKLSGRTSVGEALSADMETWTPEQVIDTMNYYFSLSVEHAEELQQTPVGIVKDVLSGDASTRHLRPTLYDLLAHKAIDALTDPVIMQADFSMFLINKVEYFADTQGFALSDVHNDDTLATAYCVMKIFHRLTTFRLKQNDINPLTDVDLKRLKFVRDNGIYPDAGVLYENALKYLLETCAGQKIWARVASALAAWYEEEGEKWVRSGDTKYRYRLADAVKLYEEMYRKATSKEDRQHTENLLGALKRKRLHIRMQQEQIPCKPILALVGYQNTDVAYVTVYRLNEKALSEFELGDRKENDRRMFLSSQEKLSQQTIQLPKQTDYQYHQVEVRLDSLEAGQYLLAISGTPDLMKEQATDISYITVQVSRLFLIERLHGKGKTEAYVTDRENGMPVGNAAVKIYSRIYNRETGEYEERQDTVVYTDEAGQAYYPVISGNRKVYVYHGNDSLVQKAIYAYSPAPVKQIRRVMLLTDRAIYRPGQTLYFKGLMYQGEDGDRQVQQYAVGKIQLMDVNGKEVAQQDFVTGEFGSFTGSFTLPHGLLNGRMQLQTPYGAASVEVEEYRRPAFEVILNDVRENYALGDSIRIVGEAKALAGYPTDEAKVRYSVSRHVIYRPLRYRTLSVFPPRQKPQRQIASGTLQTDSEGRFSLVFKAEDDDIQDRQQIYAYELTAEVTDRNGETQTASQTVRLSRKPLLLDTDVPENIVTGQGTLKYRLDVTNLNGISTPATVKVTLLSMRQPGRLLRDRLWSDPDTTLIPCRQFVADFPFDAYGNENRPFVSPEDKPAAEWEVHTSSAGEIDLDALKNLPSGRYMLRFDVRNGQGAIADSMLVTLQHADSAIIHMKQWITVAEKKGEPGDSIVFRIAGGRDSSYIRCDVLFKDGTELQQMFRAGVVPREVRLPVKEEYRGGFAVQFVMIQENRSYSALHEIEVPYTNKELDIRFQTFRSQLLPGEKEKWTLTVKNKRGGNEAAEMAAVLYDASLDMFVPHVWRHVFYSPRYHGNYAWQLPYANLLGEATSYGYYPQSTFALQYEALDIMGNAQGAVMMKSRRMGSVAVNDFDLADAPPAPAEAATADGDAGATHEDARPNVSLAEMAQDVRLRDNFAETAFFHPLLRTDEKGEIAVEFTIPESLTRWKMLGFAHTKDLKTGYAVHQLVTQKKIAVSAGLPRFFRQGDTVILAAKVNNLTENDVKANVLVRFYDAFTMQPIDAKILKTAGAQLLPVAKGGSAGVQWKLIVPEELQAVTCRITAQAGNYTDGEERSVPVLPNRILVTEAMPFMVRGDGKSEFRFDKLAGSNAQGTLQHRRLMLEYADNPAWYALQALPSLMERDNECSEQIFSRFYANSVAESVVNSTPRIRQVFRQWQSVPDSKALLSGLEKNQEFKQALLEETPWVMQAAGETERRKRIALLFDRNRTKDEQQRAWDKLKQMQGAGGGLPWFPGQPEDRYMTQHIVAGLEHMRHLNALPRTEEVNDLIERAMSFCDARIDEDYQRRQEQPATGKRRQIMPLQVHYLY
ncbi:MAG: hypothetical protein LBR08_12680, partial [Bacteroidales bacterium]|nr:hypothetical protein [Bacteroidales bacterium]